MKGETLHSVLLDLRTARADVGDNTPAAAAIDHALKLVDLEVPEPGEYTAVAECATRMRHTGACVPIALSVATGIPYRHVAAACELYGDYAPSSPRRARDRGTNVGKTVHALGLRLVEIPKSAWMPNSGELALHRIGNKLRRVGCARGRYLVFTFKHVSAVVDGEVRDYKAKQRSTKCVREVWEVVSGFTQARHVAEDAADRLVALSESNGA